MKKKQGRDTKKTICKLRDIVWYKIIIRITVLYVMCFFLFLHKNITENVFIPVAATVPPSITVVVSRQSGKEN